MILKQADDSCRKNSLLCPVENPTLPGKLEQRKHLTQATANYANHLGLNTATKCNLLL